jgi:thiosulfate/3-mercaptopyruvate sulfurtransferase
MESLVSTEWLAGRLNDPDLVVLDCTVRTEETESGVFTSSGRGDYLKGHIPGAGFADLKGELCDGESTLDFALPRPEAFCEAMGRLGVGDESRVVLYDNTISAWAARVWWMLRWVGFDRAALLDGGFRAWRAEGRPVETGMVARERRTLMPRPRPKLIAGRDEVLSAISDGRTQLIDTLPPEFYRGEASMYGRPGHIPSAVNVNGSDLVDEDGFFRPEEKLGSMHEGVAHTRAITYCGGGILASLDAFVMTRLGFEDVAVYAASLQEWAADPANPMAVGDQR